MDGLREEYNKQLVHKQNYKDKSQLAGVKKYYDKCKEAKQHAYSVEERELRKSLQNLKKEKAFNKRKGSCISNEHEDEKCKDRKPKGVVVKLQPGKIDTERMSPPNSHDVAVRMLFDKKGQCVKKKKKSKANEDLSVPEPPTQSQSHREAVLKLPSINKKTRRRSFADTEDFMRKNNVENTEPEKMLSHHNHRTSKQIYDICVSPEIKIMTPDAIRSKENLRNHMVTPTPDKWQCSPPVTPQKAWDICSPNNTHNKSRNSFEEIERVAECNQARLPQLPNSRTSLVDASKKLPQGYVRDDKPSSNNNKHNKDRNRRFSMDYRDLDFFDRRHSFIPSDHQQRRTSVGLPERELYQSVSKHDEEINKKKPRVMTEEMLEHYYSLLSENQKLLQQNDSNFCIPPDEKKHIPLCTLKRSQRRKTLALEVLLKQLPSYKHMIEINPKEMLDCRYLRLSRNNIAELEDLCRIEGQDPGIHAHMTTQEVEDYFDQLDNTSEGSESISELELSALSPPYNNQISTNCFN